MKKHAFVFACILFIFKSLAWSQMPLKPFDLVERSKQTEAVFEKTELFQAQQTRFDLEPGMDEIVKSATILQINDNHLQSLLRTAVPNIKLEIPVSRSRKLQVELVEVNLFADDFKVATDQAPGGVEVNLGKHYRGIIEGAKGSIAAFSFFEGEIAAILSIPGEGNFVLGKLKNSAGRHVLYRDDELLIHQDFSCSVETGNENYTKEDLEYDEAETLRAMQSCVRFYFETEYDIYTDKGSSTSSVSNYVSAMYNQVGTIYANESINTTISEIFIWTTADPYNGEDTEALLNEFVNNRQSFNGDIPQLLTFRGVGGGRAYINTLCSSSMYRHGVSAIDSYYSNFPTYSWTVNVVAHEFGHNFGSLHTHDCVWNGNSTAIDGCGPEAGYEGCEADLPSNGGTIMSYCHLVSGVGINFSEGFGTQPGNLIRDRVANASCLQVCNVGGNYPDYLPFNLQVNGSTNPTLLPGQGVTGTVRVKNQGTAASTVHSAGRFYYSDNSTFGDGDDQQVGPLTDLQPMAVGEEHPETVNFNIPGNAQSGTRYIFFKADSDGGSNGEIDEGPLEGNNVTSITVTINSVGNNYPDYLPFNLQVNGSTNPTLSPGQGVTGSVRVRNQGTAASTVHSAGRFYYSNNSTFGDGDDQQVGALTDLQPMAVGEEHPETVNFNIPGNAQAGTRYIFFKADSDGGNNGEIDEGPYEGNNVTSISVIINSVGNGYPDYVPFNLQVNGSSFPTLSPGQGVTGTVRVRNQGTVAATVHAAGRFYYSNNNNFGDGDDQQVGSLTDLQPMAVGEEHPETVNFNIPGNAQPGTRYIFFKADSDGGANGEIDEGPSGGENNNVASMSINILQNNRSPVLADISNRTDQLGTSVSFFVSASDPDGDPLTYNISGAPSGISINSNTGLISGTIFGNAGIYTTTVTVSDGSLSDSEFFSWTVIGNVPVANFFASHTDACQGESISFTDQSTGNPTAWSWSIFPNTISFLGGTNAGSQNPQVQFLQAGSYTITLTVSNAAGSNGLTRTNYITISGNVSPSVTVNPQNPTVCVGESLSLTASPANGGANPSYQWFLNNTFVGTGNSLARSSWQHGDAVIVNMTSSLSCASPNTVASSPVLISVTQAPTISMDPFDAVCINDAAFVLAGATPLGGTYSGTGVINGIFNPTVAGVGTHVITYSYPNTGNCVGTASQTIEVKAQNNCTPPPFNWMPTNLSALIYGQAQVDGIPATSQDWIAAFDEDGNCAGAAQIIVSAGIAYISLIIYGDDPTTGTDEGIGPGESFTLELYDASTDEYLEYPNSSNVFSFSGWTNTNGTPLQDYNNTNTIYNFQSFTADVITLNPGWNLISLDVSPADKSVGTVFAGISSLEYVTGFEGGSTFYDPSNPPFLNTLTHLKDGYGYWVKVGTTEILTVSGVPINPAYKTGLDAGWNLVAYLPPNSETPANHFSNLLANNNLQYVTGFEGGSKFYDPNGLPFLNSLTLLHNGYGYWLRVSQAVNGTQYRLEEGWYPNPNYIIVNAQTNLPPNTIGQNVEVLNEASQVVTYMRILAGNYLMTSPIYGDDHFTAKQEGVSVGEKLRFRFKNLIADPGLVYEEGQKIHYLNLHFRPFVTFEISPNPFKNELRISYYQDEQGATEFIIRDIFGREVNRILNQEEEGYQNLSWSLPDLADGVYSISLVQKGKVIGSKRLIHQK